MLATARYPGLEKLSMSLTKTPTIKFKITAMGGNLMNLSIMKWVNKTFVEVCTCVCVCVCVCVCLYIYNIYIIYICMYVYVHVYIYIPL